MAGFLEYLTKWTPLSGRAITESGDAVNLADILKRQDMANLSAAVEDGVIYQAFWRGSVAAGVTLRFAQPVNTDRIRGVAFSAVVRGGPVEYRLCVGSTIGATDETIPGYNADRRLIGSPEFASENPILRVASATGGTVIDGSFAQTPSAGAARASGSLPAAGLGGVFGANSKPCFTLQNTDNSAAQLSLVWIWNEAS
jgi:hypothetical protein